MYTRGPCPENAWLIPSVDLSEVFCECRSGFFFSPSRYACEPNAIAAEPRRTSAHPFFAKNRKPLPEGWSDLKVDLFDKGVGDDEEELGDDELEENATEPTGPKLLDHFQGLDFIRRLLNDCIKKLHVDRFCCYFKLVITVCF